MPKVLAFNGVSEFATLDYPLALGRVACDKAIPVAVSVSNTETVAAMEKTARDVQLAKDAMDLFKQLKT